MTLDPFSPFVFLLMVLCAFRLTRFFVYDSLIGGHLESGTKWSQRIDKWAFEPTGQDKNWLLAKFVTLTSCTWCAGAWCSLVTVCVFLWKNPLQLSAQEWVLAWALAGAQALVSRASRKWVEIG